ncbi:hypothetical protein [Streptomyces sp. NPDC001985]|uniref:hypothetical protein n=1 Tax=Streptomyces sp. NPDC001985 TaxID=3154406 RepID=UPI003334950F
MGRRTRTALAALPLVLAVTVTGCGSDGGGPGGAPSPDRTSGEATGGASGRASGEGEGGGGGPSAEPSPDPQERGLRFARCMRSNGIAMDDPVDGRLTLRQQREQSRRAAMEKAMKACRAYQPRGTGAGG